MHASREGAKETDVEESSDQVTSWTTNKISPRSEPMLIAIGESPFATGYRLTPNGSPPAVAVPATPLVPTHSPPRYSPGARERSKTPANAPASGTSNAANKAAYFGRCTRPSSAAPPLRNPNRRAASAPYARRHIAALPSAPHIPRRYCPGDRSIWRFVRDRFRPRK